MEVKKTFEEPKVEKVEFDFKTRIAASLCNGSKGEASDLLTCDLFDA